MTESTAGIWQRYVWNRASFNAILLSAPALLTAAGSFVMSRSVDAEIAVLTQRRDRMTETARQLEGFTRDVERLQLDRAALLLVMNAQGAEPPLKFALDRLFRLNALGSMRRVAATLYPGGWKERMQPYEERTEAAYDKPETVGELQALESGMIADAGRELTMLQEKTNGVAAEIDRKTAFRTTILSVGNSLMYLVTILVFFLKTNMK